MGFRWQINVVWLNNEPRKAFFFFFLVWSFMFWTPTLSIRNITCLISTISTKGTPQLKYYLKKLTHTFLVLHSLLPAPATVSSSHPHLSSLLSVCVSCIHIPVSLPISASSFPILEACSLKFAKHLSKEALCLKHNSPKSLCWKPSKYQVKNVWRPGPLGLKC